MEKYQYKKGMKEIILEMKQLLKDNENSAVSKNTTPIPVWTMPWYRNPEL